MRFIRDIISEKRSLAPSSVAPEGDGEAPRAADVALAPRPPREPEAPSAVFRRVATTIPQNIFAELGAEMDDEPEPEPQAAEPAAPALGPVMAEDARTYDFWNGQPAEPSDPDVTPVPRSEPTLARPMASPAPQRALFERPRNREPARPAAEAAPDRGPLKLDPAARIRQAPVEAIAPEPAPRPAPARSTASMGLADMPFVTVDDDDDADADQTEMNAELLMPPPAAGRGAVRSGRVKTRLLGFNPESLGLADPFEKAEARANQDFPVAWLVVVAGPGRGASFSLHDGVARIGRGEDQTIALNFGDTAISRENHAAIAYDAEQNAFFVGQSGKANIVRLNNKPLLSTEQLTSGDQIRVGETTLRFVALCGETFTWAERN